MVGGREVFARDGYARASIDAIATASGVSTRTIYKHFVDKPTLFAAAVVDSARQIAEAETALIERHLRSVVTVEEVEPALLVFATDWLDDAGDWLAGMPHSAAHRALIGQVQAEAAHLGSEVISEWWRAGAMRVRTELALVLTTWAEAGLLRIPDPERAVIHFSRLVSATPGPPASVVIARERQAWIADGVRVFVRAYRP
ncbi:TetR family transcriptional regulator [Amycolatopsis antarctica]|uniref:TetR family transcriptional regulator n=2 Tax=Amycolatopsis antarctica TaxID=1854586 RepID=A0A263CZM6_9PSEU|nr:TetR family transcriptional regulator [Amycolatopsis antarctica]